MLNEFAVEPEIFSTLEGCKYWSEQFGVDRARLISRFPREWIRCAIDQIQEQEPIKRQSLIERLRRLKEQRKFIALPDRTFGGKPSWLENALDEHKRLPFNGIVAKENPNGSRDVLVAHEIEASTPGFAVQRGRLVPRTAVAMAESIRLVLREARVLILVDPYFHPSKSRFIKPLVAFLAEAMLGNPLSKVQIHLHFDSSNSVPTAIFQSLCHDSLPSLIPMGVDFQLHRWMEIHQGDSFHARYILTELCGVRFDHGLDQENEYEKSDVELVDSSIHQERLAQFSPGSTAYKLVDSTTIVGVRRT